MQRSLHFSFEIYYHSNMCHFLWKTRQAHSKPTLLHWTHLLSLMGDTISQKNDRLSASRIRSLMLEVPEASISLSSPSPHLFRLLPLQPRWSEEQQVDGKQHTHTHTHSYASWRSANTLHMDSVQCRKSFSVSSLFLLSLIGSQCISHLFINMAGEKCGWHIAEHLTTQWKRPS